MMHGDVPYSIATAMINASPMPIIVPTGIKTRNAGTVARVNRRRITQYMAPCCGVPIKSHTADATMGNASAVTALIKIFTLSGSCFHVMATNSDDNSSDPLSAIDSRGIRKGHAKKNLKGKQQKGASYKNNKS